MARATRVIHDARLHLSPRDLLAVQRVAGNSAVRNLLASRAAVARDVSDPDEREADHASRQAMLHVEASASAPGAAQLGTARPARRTTLAGGHAVEASTATAIDRARGGGESLPDRVREPMERAFGEDFRGVRVHADAEAHALSSVVGARAFATGRDLFFQRGVYRPGERGGQEVIAHELAHVVQQGAGAIHTRRDGHPSLVVQRMMSAEELRKESVAHEVRLDALIELVDRLQQGPESRPDILVRIVEVTRQMLRDKSIANIHGLLERVLQDAQNDLMRAPARVEQGVSDNNNSPAQGVSNDNDDSSLAPTRRLPFRGVHGTDTATKALSVEQGLNWERQKKSRTDVTEYSGPGFYFVPGLNFGFGRDHNLAIYVDGLDPSTRLPDVGTGPKRIDTSRIPDSDGVVDITKLNHPINLWVERQTDQGREVVLRPHLYDRGELRDAIKVAAAMPFTYDPRDRLSDRGMVLISPHDELDAYVLDHDSSENVDLSGERAEMGDVAYHAAYIEAGSRLGAKVLLERYDSLEMPSSVFKLLLHVAEFDVGAKRVSKGQSPPDEMGRTGETIGTSILPSRQELSELIDAAKAANPGYY